MKKSQVSPVQLLVEGVVEEINTTLTSISIRAGQLSQSYESMTPAEIRAAAIEIEATTFRISGIVRALRAYARDSENDTFQKVKVKNLIQDSISLCYEKLLSLNIEIQVLGVSHSLEVECRQADMIKVIYNIIVNSQAALEPVTPRMIIIEANQVENGVEISILNNGDTKNGRNNISENAELINSKNIVEKHKGTFLQENDSKFTRYIVRLPKSQANMVCPIVTNVSASSKVTKKAS
jgi:light-regulated signal transduction histidine kinase (bacteriophytochrome)